MVMATAMEEKILSASTTVEATQVVVHSIHAQMMVHLTSVTCLVSKNQQTGADSAVDLTIVGPAMQVGRKEAQNVKP